MGLLRRTPIVARLVTTFVLVSLLPIGTLAALAVYESRDETPAHVEGEVDLGECGLPHQGAARSGLRPPSILARRRSKALPSAKTRAACQA